MASGNQKRSKKSAQKLSSKRDTFDKSVTEDIRKKYLSESDGEEEKVICFCGDDRELGEMACCELCAGWFHFRCMRFKENVNLLEKRDFVCCFCLASRTLSLIREVESLKKEVQELRAKRSTEKDAIPPGKKSEQAPKKKNRMLPEREKEASYSEVVRRSKEKEQRQRREDTKPVELRQEKKESTVEKRSKAIGKSTIKSPSRAGEYVGRRKLWGTKKVDTEEDVKKLVVSRVPEAASIEVKRVFKSEDGRCRWWFWLIGEESILKLVDRGDYGGFWKVEKKSPFLDSVVVRVLGR